MASGAVAVDDVAHADIVAGGGGEAREVVERHGGEHYAEILVGDGVGRLEEAHGIEAAGTTNIYAEDIGAQAADEVAGHEHEAHHYESSDKGTVTGPHKGHARRMETSAQEQAVGDISHHREYRHGWYDALVAPHIIEGYAHAHGGYGADEGARRQPLDAVHALEDRHHAVAGHGEVHRSAEEHELPGVVV